MHSFWGRMVRQLSRDGLQRTAITFADPLPDGSRLILHPGQQEIFEHASGRYPEFLIEVDAAAFGILERTQAELTWALYMQDAQPLQSAIAFREWCRF